MGQTEQAIEQGAAINDPHNAELSPMFPIFTVGIGSPDGAGGFAGYCTGTIIAPTLVLTASHCQVDVSRGDVVILYPVGLGKGALPTGTTVPVTNVAVQTGIVCDPTTPGWPDATCYSTWGSGTKHYADLAVLTVAAPGFTSPYQAVGIRPPVSALNGFFSDLYTAGRGYHNYSSVNCQVSSTMPPEVANGGYPSPPGTPSAMYWAPVAVGLFNGDNATSDQFETNWLVADAGDSGGPLLRYPPSAVLFGVLGSQYLGLIGVLSGNHGCDDGPFSYNLYTSVAQTDNYNWLQSLGAVMISNIVWPPPTTGSVETFGAAQ